MWSWIFGFLVVEAYQAATRSMARLNRTAALLMRKYGEYSIVEFMQYHLKSLWLEMFDTGSEFSPALSSWPGNDQTVKSNHIKPM